MHSAEPPAGGYWYDRADRVDVLQALRSFRRADERMRQRMSADMGMNVTDLRAMQHIIACERAGKPATPRAVATYLAISTASTTKLLDRLTVSGYLQRAPNPGDRRSLIVLPTPHGHEQIRVRLAQMHERMAAVADAVPERCRPAVVRFLIGMADELDRAEPVAPLVPSHAAEGTAGA